MPIGGVPGGYQQQQRAGQPSCMERVKMGAYMGFTIGMSVGCLIGGFSAFRHGLRGRDLVTTVGKAMLQAGGSFGTFMAVGSGLRCV
jgi:hypothetical protein